jgi:Recombinase/Resolvase, N terminal domain
VAIVPEVITMPQVAYSLIRYSGAWQREGDSKRRQESFAARWCAENNSRLDTDLSMLLDGQSAFRGKHRKRTGRGLKPLAQFLDDIKSGRVAAGSVLIMENIDRLSREEIDEAWELFRSILRAGVDVVTERPERRYTKKSLNNFAEVLEVKFGMYLAHEESVKKSERIGRAWANKKRLAEESKEPVSKSCPAWMELAPEGYRLIPDRAAVVKRIVRQIHEVGCQRLAQMLSDEGVPCFGLKGRWTSTYVRGIVRSPAVYGAYQRRGRDLGGDIHLEGKPIPGYYPNVASREEWEAAQASVQRRRQGGGRPGEGEPNLFSGILYETSGGERLHLRPEIRGGVRYQYLRPWPVGRSKVYIPYVPVEDWLVRAIGGLKAEDVLPPGQEADAKLRRIKDLSNDVMKLADLLAQLEAKQRDPHTDPDLRPSVDIGIIDVRRQQREKTKELRSLEEEANTSRTKSLGACQSALSLLDTTERRHVAKVRIRQLVESIWLLVQPVTRTSRIIHAQIYLRGGRRVYRQLRPATPLPAGVTVWQLEPCDFRAGDVGHATRHTETGA